MGRVLGSGVEFHCISDAHQICLSRCCGVTGSHLVLVECGEWEPRCLLGEVWGELQHAYPGT